MKLMDKVLNFIGYELEEEEEELETLEMPTDERFTQKGKRNNLVSLPTSTNPIKMAVAKPSSFEQVQVIADHLKNRRPVVVNVEEMDLEMAKRIVDFLSGTIYALNGSIQKVSSGIMIFLPQNAEITGDIEQYAGADDVWPLKIPQL